MANNTNNKTATTVSPMPTSKINVAQGGDVSEAGRSRSTVRIPLAQIEIGAGTQARTRIDNALAEEYAEAMQDGAFFPPVIVFSDGKNSYLADGFHRVEAARRCGFLDIDAIVEQGTARDALWYALGANKAHGLRMSRADVRRAVELALREFPSRSKREIARQIGCGDQLGLFVGGGGGDLLADLLLLRAGSFEFLQRGTANLVGAQHLVDQFDRFATLTLGFLDNVSMFTNELNIKHASQPSAESRH